VRVELQDDDSALTARVCDDGTGPAALSGKRGLGQTGMRDRATALGASYQPPRRQAGWTITEFRIPQA
jgi:two-component system sensor histidine kinase UhpB